MRRLVFPVMIGNGDMHLKNWSLLYQDARRCRLLMTLSQIRRVAANARPPVSPLVMIAQEMVERTTDEWRRLSEKELMPADLARAIGDHIAAVRIAVKPMWLTRPRHSERAPWASATRGSPPRFSPDHRPQRRHRPPPGVSAENVGHSPEV